MMGWHHQLNGHEFEQLPGDGEGPGVLQSWGHKELDTTERRNSNEHTHFILPFAYPCLSTRALGLLLQFVYCEQLC